jgi:hypothetical protein
MKPNLLLLLRTLTSTIPLLLSTSVSASPLSWFPGPALQVPVSGAATTVANGFGNVLVGGDSGSYAQSLIATNNYWVGAFGIQNVAIAAGAVADSDMIIVYGGSDGTNSTSAVTAYSLTGDSVPMLSPMSVARSYLGYARDRGGYAYAIGGLDDTGQPLSSAERFTSDAVPSGTWSAIASLPTGLYNFPAVFDGTNQIYVFGGYTNTASGSEVATVLRYSISRNTWTNMAPMPVAVASSAAALGPDGKIYVIGGISGGIATDAVQVYDPVSNSWKISVPLPEALSGAALGVDSLGRLIVMGGMDANGNDVSDVWRSQQLAVPDSAPGFVTYPSVSATYLVPYVSSITATGNPQPIYLLASGPVGMQVDTFSGAITWTPQVDQFGSNYVAIRATNYAGFADWNFAITVPYLRPTAPTNLAVAAVTETSATISWAPEDPAMGPVTYSVAIPHPWHSPRGSGGGINYQTIATNLTSTNVIISGLTPNTHYTYAVNSTGSAGPSGYSEIVVTTAGVQPPANPQITGATSTTITFAWDPPPGPVPAVSYEIWGWDDFGITTASSSYAKGITNTTFTLTGLPPGSGHNWAVRAYDALGYFSSFAFFNSGNRFVNPAPTTLLMSGGVLSGDGSFQFTVSEGGSTLQPVQIQATTNPADPTSWVQIGLTLPASSPFTFADTNSALYPARFYRAIAPQQ